MATNAEKIVSNSNDELKQKTQTSASIPIRIGRKSKVKLDQLLRQANKGRVGKKVKASDILEYALGLIGDDHLQEICNKTLSNKDRLELLYRQAMKENRNLSRDDFLGMLLKGAINSEN